jgi:hypothetical protein
VGEIVVGEQSLKISLLDYRNHHVQLKSDISKSEIKKGYKKFSSSLLFVLVTADSISGRILLVENLPNWMLNIYPRHIIPC